MGVQNWMTHYTNFENGCVRCSLGLRVSAPEDRWIHKEDVGVPAGLTLETKSKGAHSDAFKRVAVHFGIGRYLYWSMGQDRIRLYEGSHRQRHGLRPFTPKFVLPKLSSRARLFQ